MQVTFKFVNNGVQVAWPPEITQTEMRLILSITAEWIELTEDTKHGTINISRIAKLFESATTSAWTADRYADGYAQAVEDHREPYKEEKG
jgi:hypothetical protein